MTTIPNSAEEALADGWVMVCVIPTPLNPPEVLDALLAHFDQVDREVKFTHKGGLLPDQQHAIWAKGFRFSDKSTELLTLINGTRGHDVLLRVVRALMAKHISKPNRSFNGFERKGVYSLQQKVNSDQS